MMLPSGLFESEPESAGFLEEGDEGAVDVSCHYPVHGTHELSAYEDDRDGRGGAGAEQPRERALHLLTARVLVQLHHRGADAHAAEEPFHGVAHAAAAHAEDYHRALRRQPLHPLQCVHRRSPPRRHVAPRLRRRSLILHFLSISRRNPRSVQQLSMERSCLLCSALLCSECGKWSEYL